MRVVLVALYNHHSNPIRTFHSMLAKEKCEVKSVYFRSSVYVDGVYSQKEVNDTAKLISDYRPDFVGIGVHSPLFPLFKSLSLMLEYLMPDCKIIVGGDHPTASPESCINYADYVVVGEGENAIVDIVNGKADEGIIVGDPVVDIDSIPFPYYGPDAVSLFSEPDSNKFSWYASRGCGNNCTYCHESVRNAMYKPKRRVKSAGLFV